MAFSFNSLTGQLDLVGGNGSSSPSPALRYTATFNSTTDWASFGSDYTYSVAAATHGKGTTPNVKVFAQNGLNYEEVVVGVLITPAGNITISVSNSPDNRFAGLILII